MKPIRSTAEILALKVLSRSVDKKWTNWAYDMLLAGFETENLIILAGETEPFNQLELKRLADKVLEELGLPYNDHEQVLKNYICYLIGEVLDGTMKTENVLYSLKEIYIELDYEPLLREFYLLYHANDELNDLGVQWYVDGVTRENFGETVTNRFMEWRGKCG